MPARLPLRPMVGLLPMAGSPVIRMATRHLRGYPRKMAKGTTTRFEEGCGMKAVVVCHNCLKKLEDLYRIKTSDYRAGRCEECRKKSMVLTARIEKKE